MAQRRSSFVLFTNEELSFLIPHFLERTKSEGLSDDQRLLDDSILGKLIMAAGEKKMWGLLSMLVRENRIPDQHLDEIDQRLHVWPPRKGLPRQFYYPEVGKDAFDLVGVDDADERRFTKIEFPDVVRDAVDPV